MYASAVRPLHHIPRKRTRAAHTEDLRLRVPVSHELDGYRRLASKTKIDPCFFCSRGRLDLVRPDRVVVVKTLNLYCEEMAICLRERHRHFADSRDNLTVLRKEHFSIGMMGVLDFLTRKLAAFGQFHIRGILSACKKCRARQKTICVAIVGKGDEKTAILLLKSDLENLPVCFARLSSDSDLVGSERGQRMVNQTICTGLRLRGFRKPPAAT